MNQFHAKNHFVPRCYLKRWANKNRKIKVYDTLVGHSSVPVWKEQGIGGIAYRRNLYTLVKRGKESDDFERWLDREFESPAEVALEKVVNDRRLTTSDWDVLIKFLAAQDVRTPSRLIEHMNRWSKVYQKQLEETLSTLEEIDKSGDYSQLKTTSDRSKIIESLPLNITTNIESGADYGTLHVKSYIGRRTWIQEMRFLLDKTAKVLHEHKWTIIKPARGFKWFTSDNPVVKLNYTDSGNYDLKGGWGREKGNIIFPISPNHAMFVQIGDRPLQKGQRLTVSKTIEFQKIIAKNARSKIFSQEYSEEIPRLRRRLVSRDKFKNEQEFFSNWHSENSNLENEYSF